MKERRAQCTDTLKEFGEHSGGVHGAQFKHWAKIGDYLVRIIVVDITIIIVVLE